MVHYHMIVPQSYIYFNKAIVSGSSAVTPNTFPNRDHFSMISEWGIFLFGIFFLYLFDTFRFDWSRLITIK